LTLTVFTMVLGAALLHAVWNTLVKVTGDRLIVMTLIMSSQGLISLCVLPFVAFPHADAWPYILASVVLHTGYCLSLIMAYRHGDLSHVYPIARGSAPLIVAILSIAVAGEALNQQTLLAVALVTVAVMSVGLTRGATGLRETRAVLFALGTGLFIAGYTIVDGMGARVSGSAHSYTFWSFTLHGIPLALLSVRVRGRELFNEGRKIWKIGLLAGLASLLAYWIVIWAMTLAPFALVSALRETSVVFAVLVGVVLLKERLSMLRLTAIAVTLVGVVLLKTSN